MDSKLELSGSQGSGRQTRWKQTRSQNRMTSTSIKIYLTFCSTTKRKVLKCFERKQLSLPHVNYHFIGFKWLYCRNVTTALKTVMGNILKQPARTKRSIPTGPIWWVAARKYAVIYRAKCVRITEKKCGNIGFQGVTFKRRLGFWRKKPASAIFT